MCQVDSRHGHFLTLNYSVYVSWLMGDAVCQSVCMSVQVVASVDTGASSVCPPQLFQGRGTS